MIDKINVIEESLEELEKDKQELTNKEDLEASEVLKIELTELRNKLINERIKEIEKASSKTYKQNDSNDYIQLNSAYNRRKLIHKSDAEEYMELVNILRPIVQENNEKYRRETRREYNESVANLRRGTTPIESTLENKTVEVQPEQPIEEQITSLYDKIMNIANNAINEPNHGKATTVTFQGKQYKIPKKKLGEFKTLRTQYNVLRKKHNVQNIPKKGTVVSTVKRLIGDITSAILDEQPNEQPNEQQNQNKQKSDEQDDQVIGMVNNAQINRKNEKEIYDWKNEEEEENEIVAIKGNKNKNKIKNLIKQNKQKIKKAIVGVMSAIMLFATVKGFLKLNNKPTITPQEPTSSISNNTTSEQNSVGSEQNGVGETIIIEEEYNDGEKEKREQVENMQEEDKEDKESESSKKSEEKMQTGVVQEGIYIGATVNLKENVKIYKSAQDSILENNAYNPYYGYDINMVIIGVSVEYENKIINIFPNIDDANKMISDMLNNGGKVVSILTANKQNLPDNFDGNKKITNAEINQYAEGFINGKDIDLQNREERGIKR